MGIRREEEMEMSEDDEESSCKRMRTGESTPPSEPEPSG